MPYVAMCIFIGNKLLNDSCVVNLGTYLIIIIRGRFLNFFRVLFLWCDHRNYMYQRYPRMDAWLWFWIDSRYKPTSIRYHFPNAMIYPISVIVLTIYIIEKLYFFEY